MGFINKCKFGVIWCYRICHLLITGGLLALVIYLSVHSGIITSFPSAIINGNRVMLFKDMAILLLLAGFFALAFIPSLICWVQKPLKHYLENRSIQSPGPAPIITTSKGVKAINIFFALVLIVAVSFSFSFFREKMARSNIIKVFSIADQAKLSVDNFIETHNGQLPKTIAETGFTNKPPSYVNAVIFNVDTTSIKLELKEFNKVKAGASLTFVKRDHGWDCFSSGLPPIHFMQRKCPESTETTSK